MLCFNHRKRKYRNLHNLFFQKTYIRKNIKFLENLCYSIKLFHSFFQVKASVFLNLTSLAYSMLFKLLFMSPKCLNNKQLYKIEDCRSWLLIVLGEFILIQNCVYPELTNHSAAIYQLFDMLFNLFKLQISHLMSENYNEQHHKNIVKIMRLKMYSVCHVIYCCNFYFHFFDSINVMWCFILLI